MKGHLIRIDATAEGTDYPLFLASVDAPDLCHLDGLAWQPNIARLPTLSYDFFGGSFDGQITAPQMAFSVAIDGINGFFDRTYTDARIRFYRGEVGDPFSLFTLVYDGLIATNPNVADGIASFTARTDAAWLDLPLLSLYEGTGGVEGDADKTGQVKPLVFGDVRFADAALIDAVGLIYQVHDGAVDSIGAAYDRVASLGASTGNYASFAALEAATVPAGGWATCTALGLVRLGAPPDGRVAFDVTNGTGLPGAVIEAIAEVAGGSVSLPSLDADCPYALQIQLSSQATARQVIQSIADSIGAVAGMTWTGDLFVQPLAIDDDPVETLDAEGGSEIAVADVSELPISAPYWRLATEAERSFVVYTLAEVASGYTFRGTYAAATEYRVDDVVFASDGRAFVYINATPDSGNAPPALPSTSNAYWSIFGAATVGAPSGTTVAGLDADTVAGTINTDGTISTGNVVTDSVVDGAITTRARSFTSGTVALTSAATWYDLQSITVTVSSAGEEVDIDCDLQWVITDNCRVTLRLKRDSTVIFTTDDYAVNTSDNPTASFGYTDDPGAGTYTYTVQGYCNDASNASAKYRRMRALGPIR